MIDILDFITLTILYKISIYTIIKLVINKKS